MVVNLEALIAAVVAWFLAQAIKTIIACIKTKKLRLATMATSGGMPSSHTALVVALSTRVGMLEGFTSVAFAICAVFSIVVMYDATNVRQSVGLQAIRINQLLDEFDETHRINQDRLRIILGHTPVEVAAGTILGILCGLVV